MENSESEKWYDIEMLVDILLFIIPPVGIYGVYKTNKIKSKSFKYLYGAIGLISMCTIIIYLLEAF